MKYPTRFQVETADYEQLRQWARHLPEPGTAHLAEHPVTGDFFSPSNVAWQEAQDRDRKILVRICDRSMSIEAARKMIK